MIELFEKSKNEKLCVGLSLDEFKCKCKYESCRAVIVDKSFLSAYKKLRKLLNRPLKINSGYRCQQHNKDVGGVGMSQHITGRAIDISKSTISYLSDSEFEFAARESGFTFIKVYSSFYHCDVR